MAERMPGLLPDLSPPLIHGTAELTHRAFAGASIDQLLQMVDRPLTTPDAIAAHGLDRSIVHQLAFQPDQGLAMQSAALSLCQVYRVAGPYSVDRPDPVRLLVLMEPGDLMTNAPLDFLTRWLNVRMDLLYLRPGQAMPDAIPDHDVAYIGGGDIGAPAALARREWLFRSWPRPVLNDPARVSRLARAQLASMLADAPGLCSPACVMRTRAELEEDIGLSYPLLIRPVGSHAGNNLTKVRSAGDVADYLTLVEAPNYYLTQFEDYRSPDGMFRKYRVAFIGRTPFLCHMGVSANWMIHYLNAGMTVDEGKRMDEAQAMAEFDTGFARRHGQAFAALNDRIGLDYFTIDCGETRDGRLLVFEADAEAIVHIMDPPDLFPYKQPHMRRVVEAFATLLRRHAATSRADPAVAA